MPEIRFNPALSPPLSTGQTAGISNASDGESFSEILGRQISSGETVKFSKHAQQRLESRNISLKEDDMQRLNDAVDQASQKGVQDSLVFMDNLAFIVSVPAKTVVTAMPVDEAKQNVFTNIDGAVIV